MGKREFVYWGVIVVLCILIGITLGLYFQGNMERGLIVNQLSAEIKRYTPIEKPVQLGRNKQDSSIIAFQTQVILKQAVASRLELSKIKTELGTLKKITDRISLQTGYLITNKEAPYDSTAVFKTLDDGKYLKLPYTTTISEPKLFSLTLTQALSGTKIDSLRLWDNSEISIGYKKRGFFRKSEPSVLFQNRNKYLTDFNMNNVKIERKPFYDTRVFNMVLGAAVTTAAFKANQKFQIFKP